MNNSNNSNNSDKYNFDDNESLARVKNLFDTKYKCCLEKTPEFHCFDLKDKTNKIVIEVKKRYNTHNKYPTTMIGYNKYLKARQYITRGYSVYFVFEFTDGTYYYKYNNEIYKPIKGGRVDRNHPEIKEYIWIDVNNLIIFS
jgi:hypothetical protein